MRRVLARLAVVLGAAVLALPVRAEAPPPVAALTCTGCHAAGHNVAAMVPRIHGRRAEELATLLKAYRTGAALATVMDRIAKGFTDEEIEALAKWFASQG